MEALYDNNFPILAKRELCVQEDNISHHRRFDGYFKRQHEDGKHNRRFYGYYHNGHVQRNHHR